MSYFSLQSWRNLFVSLFLLTLLSLSWVVFWQVIENQWTDDVWTTCSEAWFQILWDDEVKVWESYTYTLSWDNVALSWAIVNFVLDRQDESWETTLDFSYTTSYALSGTYNLDVSISKPPCFYSAQKSITAYKSFIVYVWDGSELVWMGETLSKWSSAWTWDFTTLFKEITVDSWDQDEQLVSYLNDYSSYFQHADRMIIDTSSLWKIFDVLWKIFELKDIDVSWTDVYVIADITQSYFRRLLARYTNVSWIEKVYVTQKQYFWSLFTSLLLEDKSPESYDFVKSYSLSLEDSNKMYFLSYITDYLLFNWFPLWILTLILLLPFVWLVISFARQVVWLSVFGVFTPLLFATSMYVLGVRPSLLLLLSWGIAVILVSLLTRKVYLLYSPKVSLMMILYCIMTLVVRWLHEYLDLQWVDMSSYSTNIVIFPFVVILYVAKWVFSDSFLQFKKWRWVTLLEFFVISFFVLYILTSDDLQNIFLWAPELIIVVFILNILVGRFTWLQMTEYVRFFPLIKSYFEEE